MSCLIIVKSKTKIFAGSDSKRTIYQFSSDNKPLPPIIDNNYKKIHKVNGIFFAIAGLSDSVQLEIATQLCTKATSMENVFNQFSKKMKLHYESSLEEYRTKHFSWYQDRMKYKFIANMAFFQIQNGIPGVMSVRFMTLNSDTETVRVDPIQNVDPTFTVLGSMCHIGSPTKEELAWTLSRTDEQMLNLIRTMIREEIRHHPDSIGEPVITLRVGKDLEEWLPKKS